MILNGVCFADFNNCWMVSFEFQQYPSSQYGGRIFYSTNEGLNWFISLTINSGESGNPFYDVYFINPSTGFVSGFNHFFMTSNSGTNWIDLSNNIGMDSRKIYFINSETGYSIGADFNPPRGNAVIKFTTNHGMSWTTQMSVGGNIYTSHFYGIKFINNDTGWVCGYYDGIGGVIYKTTNGGIINIKNISDNIPNFFSLSQNYPNPFNPSTKIKFSVPLSRGVPEGRGVLTILKIYDILGREVATLVNEELKPGSYEYEWNAGNIASGMYFYKLETKEFTQTRRMVLLK